MSQAKSNERTMKQVLAEYGITSVEDLDGFVCAGYIEPGHYESIFNWTMNKSRKFDIQMNNHFPEENGRFKDQKAIGKESEKAVLDKFKCLRDNTLQNLKNTDLISKFNKTHVEVKAAFSPCYSPNMVDKNYRKKELHINVFDQHSRPGSLFRALMQDPNAFVIFHIYEYAYDTETRKQAFKEREQTKKPLKIMPSSTHFKIYRIHDLIQRLFQFQSNGFYYIQNEFDAKIEIEKYKDLEITDVEFRKLMTTKSKKS